MRDIDTIEAINREQLVTATDRLLIAAAARHSDAISRGHNAAGR